MERITLLDTSVGTTNKGDELIMLCVEEELEELCNDKFVVKASTHLPISNMLQSIGRLPDSLSEIDKSKYKFVCGTNLLQHNMLHRCNQWNIDVFNSKAINGAVCLGVGSTGYSIDKKVKWYTKILYKKVLSDKYIHSVREDKSKVLLDSIGIKSVNTGCVTLWKLKPEFCSQIPTKRSDSVIFTLTDYKKAPEYDRRMIEILKENYTNISFWVQGIYDLDYLESLTDISDIKILNPSVHTYKEALEDDVDYIGTRLHAGIFAMRNRKRAIILSVDDRMESVKGCISNNCISRSMVENLGDKINSSFETRVEINWESIDVWKGQFV